MTAESLAKGLFLFPATLSRLGNLLSDGKIAYALKYARVERELRYLVSTLPDQCGPSPLRTCREKGPLPRLAKASTMKTALLAFCLLLTALPASATPETDLAAWCEQNSVEQASAVLVSAGKPPLYINFAKSTQTTPYLIASCSKSFTALAVAQQIAEKKIGLDQPVITYLPWLRLSDAGATDKVTIRHLLSHTSGLPKSAGNRRYSGILQDGVRALADVSLVAPPGQQFEYSNANYMVLGAVLEAVTAQPFSDYIKARILDPLGMNLSSVGTLNGRVAIDITAVPAAGVASTSEDMALYLKAHLGDGGRVIPTGLPLHTALIPQIDYGFGWFCDGTGTWANHQGEWLGGTGNYQCYMALRPKSRRAITVLSKLQKGSPAPNWHELEPALLKACP